eukprot:GFKZ01008409.1.p1 GENE.GFKZ01008409.1~~GFKZ01008409.1.p1  ORF type:complete len:404 (+),score=39.28 GFKZ01008409.1:128-1213(+)
MYIMAWNCNGLTSRLRAGDTPEIESFVAKRNPDLIFLSEVRVSAATNSTLSKPGPNAKIFRSRMRDSDKKSFEDTKLVNKFLFGKVMRRYKTYLSLADTKYAGTAMLVNTESLQVPSRVKYNLDGDKVKGHDNEGRVIFATFDGISILHTYVPNNGWDETHFKRRREWDLKVRAFVKAQKEADVKLMWIGDLNVAPLDADLSHAAYYRSQTGGRKGRPANSPPLAPEDKGQPGCTDAERRRFREILEDGNLMDAYRELVAADYTQFTWRGNTTGIHAGRGMRIDHCIVSRDLKESIRQVEVTGHGANRVGFLGSDHCPLFITRDMKLQAGEGGNRNITHGTGMDRQSAGNVKEVAESVEKD